MRLGKWILIQSPPFQDKNVPVMICITRVEAFLCPKAIATAVAIPQERSFSAWRKSPHGPQSNQGIHFTRQILHQVCKICLILHFYCAYQPQSSGFVELIRPSKLNWQNLLNLLICFGQSPSLVLLNLRSTPFGKCW